MTKEASTVHMTSREFNRDVAKAKRAAKDGPVIVTDRGKPAHVLLDYEEYRRLSKRPRTLAEALYDDRSADAELYIEPRRIEPPRELNLED